MDLNEIVAAYGAAWNETDEGTRRKLLEQSWADDAIYQDPMGRAEGRDALVAHIGGFQGMMPGHTIDMTSGLDARDNVFRFAWVMRNGTEDVLEGMDYGELAADGRISKIVGFFGPFPSHLDRLWVELRKIGTLRGIPHHLVPRLLCSTFAFLRPWMATGTWKSPLHVPAPVTKQAKNTIC